MIPEVFTIQSTSKLFNRKVWYFPSATRAKRIAIFLDAEIYMDRMDMPAILAELESDGLIPPTACLFVSNLDAEARHHDYTCSDPYADYIARDLIPWACRKAGTGSLKDHFIGGVSLSGLQAAYTSLCFPENFTSVLSQSGSFWWEDGWLTKHLRELHPNPGKYWLSVGTHEKGAGMIHAPTDLLQPIDQDIAIRDFSAAMKANGSKVRDHVYEGGHDPVHWQAELPEALRWLLG